MANNLYLYLFLCNSPSFCDLYAPNNRCVVNERFISPFRGTYNDNDLRHVTLYAFLKAFRFTGSPVLYLECEIHMCQSACPVSVEIMNDIYYDMEVTLIEVTLVEVT